MKRTPQCFYCHKFARVEDCVLLRNKTSGIRRWFHTEDTKPACVTKFDTSNWEEIDFSLGETTDEEERRIAKQREIIPPTHRKEE